MSLVDGRVVELQGAPVRFCCWLVGWWTTVDGRVVWCGGLTDGTPRPASAAALLFCHLNNHTPYPLPFKTTTGATYALERLDGQELGGRPLKIRPAIKKSPSYGYGQE